MSQNLIRSCFISKLKNNNKSFRDPWMQGLHEAAGAQIVLLSPLKLGFNGLKANIYCLS